MKTRRSRKQCAQSTAAAATSGDELSATSDVEGEEETAATTSPTSTETKTFTFNGQSYSTYLEMVNAKRKRNLDVLASSGLLDARAALDDAATAERRAAAASRGLKRAKVDGRRSARGANASLPRRKSSRIAGVVAPDMYIESEEGGRIEVSGGASYRPEEAEARNYNNRINDGSDLSVSEAVELTGKKWVKEGTVDAAERFMSGTLTDIIDELPISPGGGRRKGSPTSVARGPSTGMSGDSLRGDLDALSLDDADACVAKVVPDRIYSVTCHPSPDKLVVCAGDKRGHLGVWNVDQHGGGADDESTDGVHLFKPQGGAISSLAWNASGTTLLSASYDGSVRAFDANKQVFEEVFATYDDSAEYKDKLGYGLDHGYNSWIQSMEIDHRYESGKCFFLSTSEGGVIHVDLRSRGKVTFDQTLSPKKINTVSLHPNGHTMATAGLSGVVQLWDVRNMPSKKQLKPFAWQSAGRSINSAYFSPSGKTLLTTTQSNTLDLMDDFHLASGNVKPTKSVRHDNQTGRWLSTFMARWHPGAFGDRELFVVGSMSKPRTIEVFDDRGELLREIRGEALTAVASRCCFHPGADKIIAVGGNSSGRVTVAR